uniref:histidine kinase n=1 Tax=Magnetococcus massalia (strain MO-1) TaxID=451514 RepID=A0A1S7LHI1_MAGMO|nr:Putative two-component hybrid sensor and regulator [Candidatus Magnetococcus massalia]
MTKQLDNIMIVDDEPLNINYLNEILKHDYRVKVATNGWEALKRAKSDPRPDLILLDVQMVEIDGYEVCRRLKQDPTTQQIPIIFITSMTEEEDEEKGLSLGAVDYILKPLRPSIILARIKTHLGLKHAHEALALRNRDLENLLIMRETIENISRHDLKAPLNGILGATQVLMEEDYLRPEDRELVAMQERAGYKMLELINRSLDMMKMEQGKYKVDAEPVDILKLLRHICTEVPDSFFQFLVDGLPAAPEEPFFVLGEELLCYSMLSNLIKNAAEASPKNRMITISINRSECGVVKIHNHGMVPHDIREQFFDKYVTSGKKSGSGLGNYSARLIAETLGGEIRMETSSEMGTTLTLLLPLSDILNDPMLNNYSAEATVEEGDPLKPKLADRFFA